MVPTIGRTVHVTLPEGHANKGGHRAAVITAVYADAKGIVADGARIDVTVFLMHREEAGQAFLGALGFLFLENLACDPSAAVNGTWHEPERAEVPKKTERAA